MYVRRVFGESIMLMGTFIFLCLFPFIILAAEASEINCPMINCSHEAPLIRFPFRLIDQQPKSCGYPGFNLFCKENTTTIHFSSYGDLIVNSISYEIPKLNLLDPKNCVHGVFLNLNLSLTPFRYYNVLKKYKYINCSSSLSPSFVQIPCLSGSQHHVYTVESSLDVPDCCRLVKTIAIPFSYSPYLSDNSFGLGLTWDSPSEDSKEKTEQVRWFETALGKVLTISIIIVVMATLVSMEIYRSKKLDGQNRVDDDLVFEMLLRDY